MRTNYDLTVASPEYRRGFRDAAEQLIQDTLEHDATVTEFIGDAGQYVLLLHRPSVLQDNMTWTLNERGKFDVETGVEI